MKYKLLLIFTLFSNLIHPSWFDTYKDGIKSVFVTYPKTTICFAIGLGGGLYFKEQSKKAYIRYKKEHVQSKKNYEKKFDEAVEVSLKNLKKLTDILVKQQKEYDPKIPFDQVFSDENINLYPYSSKKAPDAFKEFNEFCKSELEKLVPCNDTFVYLPSELYKLYDENVLNFLESPAYKNACEKYLKALDKPHLSKLANPKLPSPPPSDPRYYPDYRLYQGYSTLSKACFGLSTAAALYGLSQAGWVQSQNFIKTASDLGALFLANTSGQTNIPLITHK